MNKKFRIPFLILCLNFPLVVLTQQIIFKTYTVQDGLVSNPIRRIYQDSRGFMWIGTWEGLSKYDGNKFTNYTIGNGLSYNMVNDIYESPDSKLYVAENNGTVDILQHDIVFKKAAFQNVTINQFYETQNKRVIAGTDTSGLQEIKNGDLVKPIQQLSHSSFNDIADLNDSLLIGGSEGSLLILNRKFEVVAEIKKRQSFLTNEILKDSKNRVWVGTNDGLMLLSIQQTKDHVPDFTLVPAPFNLPALRNYNINDILEDAKGNLWVATSHDLVKIGPDGNWQLFSEKDGLPSSYIECIYQDKEKNIWIGTSLGLAKLVTKNDIRIYAIEGGWGSTGFSFLLPLSKNIFLKNTETGLQLFNSTKKSFTHVASSHIYYRGYVKNSYPVLFYGDYDGFEKYDPVIPRLDKYMLQGLPPGGIFSSVIDANGIIFAGTQTGLAITSSKKIHYDNKFVYRITDLLIDKNGYLWIATWENGLYRVRYTVIKTEPDIYRVSLSVQDFSNLLPDKNIRCIVEDRKNNIWVGTRYKGIVQLKHEGGEQYSPMKLDIEHGLTSNWIRSIAEDKNGFMWIGSNLGIDKLVLSDGSFHVFNFSRVNNYFTNINAIVQGHDHSLWFTTSSGVINVFDGETEKTPAPPVYITSVELGDSSFNYNTYHADKKLQLRYFQNQAKFEFSAPGFVNEKQILYSYRLLGGVDTSWTMPANLHNVSYASLQPGSYTFEVRTIGWNGTWSVPANFEFIIRSPFWKTWWFYLIIGFVVLLFFYALYLYRIRQFLKLQKVRNRIATDLHDDIGATLTNINMLSEISRKNLAQPLEAEKFLSRISEEVTASSQALNDIIWNVNSRNDSMEETLSRMRRYAADLFDNSNTICHLSMQETAAGKKLNMEQRRDVYLIYKESMNNVHKHATAANVWINIHRQKGNLHLKIKDDGKGFEPSIITDRNGLKNIRSRTEKWKGSLSVKTAPGSGTDIEIIIPLEG